MMQIGNPVDFTWIPKEKDPSTIRGEEIDPPASFHLMKKYADEIAKLFDYVRVDFYDVDGHYVFWRSDTPSRWRS